MPSPVFHTYVIELTTIPGAVYVGETSKTPEERLAQHHEAGRLAARVFRRGARGRLRPDLCGRRASFATREAAKRAERRLAERLERRGWRVYWG